MYTNASREPLEKEKSGEEEEGGKEKGPFSLSLSLSPFYTHTHTHTRQFNFATSPREGTEGEREREASFKKRKGGSMRVGVDLFSAFSMEITKRREFLFFCSVRRPIEMGHCYWLPHSSFNREGLCTWLEIKKNKATARIFVF